MERTGIVGVVLFAVMLSCGVSAQSPGFTEHEIVSAGAQRSYLLYVPESAGTAPVPLVFSFHGSGGVPQNQVGTSQFDKLAEEYGFAVVFPAGEFTNSITARSWNANVEAGVDDVQFVRDMIEAVARQIPLDRSRIYTSGFSGGGRISSRLACELSDVLAAAAPVAGLQYPDDCSLRRPIPLISFHARDDQVNTYTVSGASRPYWRMGVETALEKWRQANGCSLANEDAQLAPTVTRYQWTDCANGADIHFYLTQRGGHTWPGSAAAGANQAIDATRLIWAFFQQHSRE